MIVDGALDLEGDGEWSDVLPWSIIPLHSIVLPDGKVLSFGTTEQGMQGGQFVYDLWDPVTNVHSVLPNTTKVNTFCSNMAIDPSTGNVIIMGGDGNGMGGQPISGINDVVVFDYKTREIRDAEQGDMNYARWYGSTVTLPNGELLILGGRDENYAGSSIPEIFNAETGFRSLTGADMPDLKGASNGTDILDESWWYPHMWVDSKGDVIVVEAHGDDIYRLNTDGDGSVEKIGKLPFEAYKLNTSIMFAEDKVAIVGDDGHIWVGDLAGDVPVFTQGPALENSRIDAGMSILPDGRIAITGGGGGGQGNDLDQAEYSATIWDPVTNEITAMADQALARLYHASALILPDGTVFSGGGGAPGPLNNTNAEVFMPDYLFGPDGELTERPEIVGAPKNVGNGETFRITVDDASAIASVSMTKSGAMTHARNSDARFFELAFTVIDADTIEVTTLGATVMTPGLWMLNTVDRDGVPSVAKLVGVEMDEIVETGPLVPSTEAYNNEVEQIDGAFDLTVEARFDNVDEIEGDGWQRVFDFGNGEFADNIWLGQVGKTSDMRFEIIKDGVAYNLTAENAIVEGEIATWGVSVGADGLMRLSKNGVVVAEGAGTVPADVERVMNYFGDSNFASDSRLDGMVRNLVITQPGDPVETPDLAYAIDGVFTATVVARFDNVAGGDYQRLFDFGNGAGEDNVWMGQVGNTNDMAFEIWQGGMAYRVVAKNAIVEGETAVWAVTVDANGIMRVYKDFAQIANGEGVVPADVDRANELVGRSNWANDTPLIGEVLDIDVDAGLHAFFDGGSRKHGEFFFGSPRDESVFGTAGHDRFAETKGVDRIDGRDGFDTVVVSGSPDDYRVSVGTDGSVVLRNVTSLVAETKIMLNVEAIYFSGPKYQMTMDTLLQVVSPDGPGTPDPEPPVEENQAPVANDDGLDFSLSAGEAVTGDTAFMLDNDTDADGDPLQVVSVEAFSLRGAAIRLRDTNGDGIFDAIDYDPTVSDELASVPSGSQTQDVVFYTISDGRGGTATAQVNLTIDGVADIATPNDAPVANDDYLWFSLAADEAVTGETGFMLYNDTDLNGDSLEVVSVDATSARGAAVRLRDTDGDGTFDSIDYDPTVSAELRALEDGSQVEDLVSYTISDGRGGTSTATIHLTIDGTAVPLDTSAGSLDMVAFDDLDFAGEAPADGSGSQYAPFEIADVPDHAAA